MAFQIDEIENIMKSFLRPDDHVVCLSVSSDGKWGVERWNQEGEEVLTDGEVNIHWALTNATEKALESEPV